MPQTGATRYQKFLKSEKSKTKLKAKKDLPKGTNVTKTNFKVKKIVIKEQLKKHIESEWLSTRKLNVNELLSRLKHFNTHTKKEALEGLKELVNIHPEVLEQNLGQIINGVTPLTLDIEKIVRRECLQVLNKILTSTSIQKVDPFYDIMSTYLRSAMTNIDYRLQEDSLLFLDILLVCTPQKVAEDFHKIIPNFLSMISKLRVDSKPGRTLTVNLGSQMTSVKWRVKVLHRLQDYLNKFVQYEHIDDDRVVAETTKMFDNEKMNYNPLFNPNYTAVCHLSCFSSNKAQETAPVDEVCKFIEYIDTLMPLLFETWLEVCPQSSSERNFETVVSEDAAFLLKHTLEVITLLWSIVQHFNKKNPSSNIENIFCQKYRQQYTQHFVKTFPYVLSNVRMKQKNETTPFENVITDPKLVAENCEICHLFILLNPKINVKVNNQEIVSVLNYIEKTFNQNTQDSVNSAIIKILHTIFSKEINGWTKNLIVMDSLFRKIIWAYFNKTMSSSSKQKFFGLMCQIALNDNLSHFHKTDAFDKWRTNLPDILMDSTINVQTLNIIQKYASLYNKSFNEIIAPKLLRIVENLPSINITDAVNDTTYYKLFSLLYWIRNWDSSSLDLLEHQLMAQVYKSDHMKFIYDTLRLNTLNKT